MKKKCNECKREFSEHLIQVLHTNDKGKVTNAFMCPICALEKRNAEAGFPIDTPFTGTMAKAYHKEALAEVEKMRREKK